MFKLCLRNPHSDSCGSVLEKRDFQFFGRSLLNSTALVGLVVAGSLAFAPVEASAQQFWDGIDTASGNGVPGGGAGTWDAGTQSWTDDNLGTNNQAWAAGNGAFGGGGGIVEIDGAQTVTGLTFSVGGYLLNDDLGAAGSIVLNGTTESLGITDLTTIEVTTGTTAIFVPISGANDDKGLLKTGAGTLDLAAANTYKGTTKLDLGTLRVLANDRINVASDLVFTNGTLDLNGFTENVGGLSGTGGNIDIGNDGQLAVYQNTASSTYSGGFSGTASVGALYFDKHGAGTLTLAGTSAISGGGLFIISEGRVAVQNGNAISDNSIVMLFNNAQLELLSNETIGAVSASKNSTKILLKDNILTLAGNGTGGSSLAYAEISGDGGIVMDGVDFTQWFNGVLTYTGSTVVKSGILKLGTPVAMKSSDVQVTGGELETAGGALAEGTVVDISGTGLFDIKGAETITTLNVTGADAEVTIDAGISLMVKGTTTNTGTIDIGDLSDLSSGVINNNAGGIIKVGQQSTLRGTANTLNNAGIINVGTSGQITDAGDINNLAGGVINFNGPGGVATLKSDTNTIINDGAINVLSGSDVAVFGNVTNQGGGGVINVTDGRFGGVGSTLTNNSTAAIGISVSAGSYLSAISVVNGSGATISSSGIINSNITNNGTFNAQGRIESTVTNNTGGTFNLTGGLRGLSNITNAGTFNGNNNTLGGIEETLVFDNTGVINGGFNTANGMTFTLNNEAGSVWNIGDETTLTFDGEDTINNGGTINSIGTVNFNGVETFNNTSLTTLFINGNTTIVGGVFNNTSGISMVNGNTTDKLTITGIYSGNGGVLNIETALGDDASATDLMEVASSTAGSTTLGVKNVGGTGAQTINGIKVIEVKGASAADFVLNGDFVTTGGEQAVGAGAFGYVLNKNTSDGDWYLTSSFQPGTVPYEVYPQILQALNASETFYERTGGHLSTGGRDGASAGAISTRIEGSFANISPKISTTGSTYDVATGTVHVGIDSMALDTGNGQLFLGVNARYGTAHGNVTSSIGNGTIDTEAYGVGLSATWLANNGFYLDGQAGFNWFNSDLNSSVLGNLVSDNKGNGHNLSLEAGMRHDLTGGWTVTPQAQLTYAAVSFDDFTGIFGGPVSLTDGQSLLGRIGVLFEYEASGIVEGTSQMVYGFANITHEFLDGTEVDVSGTKFRNQLDDVSGEIGAGFNISLEDDKYNFFGQAAVATSLENFGNSSNYSGSLGLRIRF